MTARARELLGINLKHVLIYVLYASSQGIS